MEAFHFFVCILFYFMRDTIFFQKIVKYFAKAVGFLMVDDSDTETAPQDVARAGGHRRVALLPRASADMNKAARDRYGIPVGRLIQRAALPSR